MGGSNGSNGFRGPLPPIPVGGQLVGQPMTLKCCHMTWVYECSCGETLLFVGNAGIAAICNKCRQFVKIAGFETTPDQKVNVAASFGRASLPDKPVEEALR